MTKSPSRISLRNPVPSSPSSSNFSSISGLCLTILEMLICHRTAVLIHQYTHDSIEQDDLLWYNRSHTDACHRALSWSDSSGAWANVTGKAWCFVGFHFWKNSTVKRRNWHATAWLWFRETPSSIVIHASYLLMNSSKDESVMFTEDEIFWAHDDSDYTSNFERSTVLLYGGRRWGI